MNSISYQIDFIKVNSKNNGSCAIIYSTVNGVSTFNLVDAGYKNTYNDIKNHIDEFYASKY